MLRAARLAHHSPRNPALLAQSRSVNVFSVFTESIKRQVEENKEFQKNVKLLGEQSSKIAESDAVSRAREVASKTSETTSKVLGAVGTVVDKTLETPVVKMTGEAIVKTAETVAHVSQKVAEPIANTTAAKVISSSIKEVVDSSSSAFYAEYKPKEVRERERQERIEAAKRRNPLGADPSRPVLPNPDAGGNVVMHKSSQVTEAWRKFAEDNPLGRTLFAARRKIEESDNPVLERFRGLFTNTRVEETEYARTVRALKQVDPSFTVESFLKEATQYTIPELMEAFIKSDVETLKEWCSEAAMAKLSAGFESQRRQGLISDSKLLDIRNVDVRQLTLLNEEVPIVLVGFTTQEILLFRNAKGEIAVGRDDAILTASYAMAFTKAQLVDPESAFNPVTNGWLVVDFARHAQSF
ncbi:protein translocase subunit [Polyrhizophydium stewartii]|uniref:Protein translocase subunit n=1 Tax=Polyrhizophydium stewartii TaxID=2732419 RepID=A0ABR4N8Q8_9FUNG